MLQGKLEEFTARIIVIGEANPASAMPSGSFVRQFVLRVWEPSNLVQTANNNANPKIHSTRSFNGFQDLGLYSFCFGQVWSGSSSGHLCHGWGGANPRLLLTELTLRANLCEKGRLSQTCPIRSGGAQEHGVGPVRTK